MANLEELKAKQDDLQKRIAKFAEIVAEGKRAQLEVDRLNLELLANMKAIRDLDDPFAKVTEFPITSGSTPSKNPASKDAAMGTSHRAGGQGPENSSQSSSAVEPPSDWPSASSFAPAPATSSAEPAPENKPADSGCSAPIDLNKLQEMTQGADLLVLSRVYFSTAERALKDARQALINKDFRTLKAVARELENQSQSYSTPEIHKLSIELQSAASSQDEMAGKIFVEAMKLALETVKSFVYSHHA